MTSFDFAVCEDGRTIMVTGRQADAPPVTAFLLPDGLTLDDDAILRIAPRDFGTLLVEGDGWTVQVAMPSEVAEWLLNETVKDALARGMADE